MNNLFPAMTIGIIGGADGPTTIYVASGVAWFYALILILFHLLMIFLALRFVKNIWLKTILCAVFGMILLLVLAGLVFMSINPKLQSKEIPKVASECKNDILEMTQNQFWSESEITGHTLELISETQEESFSFFINDDGLYMVSCTIGEEGGWLAGPVEYWSIDDSGILCIYPDSENPSKNSRKLQKREIDTENGIAYVLRDGKSAMYFYKRFGENK